MLAVVRQSGLWIRSGSARKAPSRSTRRSRKVRGSRGSRTAGTAGTTTGAGRVSRRSRPRLPPHTPELRRTGDPRLPLCDTRIHLLDVHPYRRGDLGERVVGTLLGLRRQGGLDVRDLGAVRRLHPRPCDARLARHEVRLAVADRVRRGAVQLHDRQPLQRLARLLRHQRTPGDTPTSNRQRSCAVLATTSSWTDAMRQSAGRCSNRRIVTRSAFAV